jgi:hypothetical protein
MPWTIALATPPSRLDLLAALAGVHILGEATHVGLVAFHFADELIERSNVKGVTDAMD